MSPESHTSCTRFNYYVNPMIRSSFEGQTSLTLKMLKRLRAATTGKNNSGALNSLTQLAVNRSYWRERSQRENRGKRVAKEQL